MADNHQRDEQDGTTGSAEDIGDRGDSDELDRARQAIIDAAEHASGSIHEQLQSIEGGLFEEEEGVHTQASPGPKVDRVAEVAQKLDALADETRTDEEQPDLVGRRIGAARDHVRRYLKDHPQGG